MGARLPKVKTGAGRASWWCKNDGGGNRFGRIEQLGARFCHNGGRPWLAGKRKNQISAVGVDFQAVGIPGHPRSQSPLSKIEFRRWVTAGFDFKTVGHRPIHVALHLTANDILRRNLTV